MFIAKELASSLNISSYMFVMIAMRKENMTRKMKAKRYILKHFKFPISISYQDPMESLPKAIELLLIDMKENGTDRWNVEEITEEWGLGEVAKPVDLAPKEEFSV